MTDQQLLVPIKSQVNSSPDHQQQTTSSNNNGNEYYSLQEQFIDQLIAQLALLPPGVKPEQHSSPAVQAAKSQLTQITNQFMKQGIYCLEDLLQLPSLLLSQYGGGGGGKRSGPLTEAMREQLTSLLMKFFDDLEISKFYQLKMIHFLIQQQQTQQG